MKDKNEDKNITGTDSTDTTTTITTTTTTTTTTSAALYKFFSFNFVEADRNEASEAVDLRVAGGMCKTGAILVTRSEGVEEGGLR